MNKITFKEWLETLGFKFMPFSKDSLTGDGEPDDLDLYFLPLRFFDNLLNEDTRFLFGESGSGKSINRRMVAIQNKKSWSSRSNIKLSINYLEFANFDDINTVTINDHLKNILILLVKELYEFILQAKNSEDTIIDFGDDIVELIEKHASGLLDESKLRSSLRKELESITKAVTRKNIFSAILNNDAQLFSVSLAEIPQKAGYLTTLFKLWEIKRLGKTLKPRSYFDDLEILKEIAQSLNIKQVFILIDQVDQQQTKVNDQEIVNMLNPLLRCGRLVERDNFYKFKFFLPLNLKKYIDMQRFKEDTIDWKVYAHSLREELKQAHDKRELLEKLLDERVAYCYAVAEDFSREPPTFVSLFEDKIRGYVIADMVKRTNHSPRDLLKLAYTIVAEHTQFDKMELCITKETYDTICGEFQPLIDEVYPKLKQLSSEKLSILAYDYFRYIYDKFTKKTGQEDKVDLLIDELNENKSKITQLLKYIEKWR